MFFRDFPQENREKIQKHSKKNLKRFETISFLDDQKIELRTVGKHDQAATVKFVEFLGKH